MTEPTQREAALGVRYDTDGRLIADKVLPNWVWGDESVWQRAEELHTAHPDIVRGVNREQHSIVMIIMPIRDALAVLQWVKHGRGPRPRL